MPEGVPDLSCDLAGIRPMCCQRAKHNNRAFCPGEYPSQRGSWWWTSIPKYPADDRSSFDHRVRSYSPSCDGSTFWSVSGGCKQVPVLRRWSHGGAASRGLMFVGGAFFGLMLRENNRTCSAGPSHFCPLQAELWGSGAGWSAPCFREPAAAQWQGLAGAEGAAHSSAKGRAVTPLPNGRRALPGWTT